MNVPPLYIAEKFQCSVQYVYNLENTGRINDICTGYELYKKVYREWQEYSGSGSPSVDTTKAARERIFEARRALEVKRLKKKVKTLKFSFEHKRSNIRVMPSNNGSENPGAPFDAASRDTSDNQILDELNSLAKKKPNTRRYSEMLYRFAYVFFTLSPRAYKYVRKRIPLPAKSSLYEHFAVQIENIKGDITNIALCHRMVEAFVGVVREQPVICCLAVDAFAFRLFLRQIASINRIRQVLNSEQLNKLKPILEDQELIKQAMEEEMMNDAEFEDAKIEFKSNSELDTETIGRIFDSYNSCFIFQLIPLKSGLSPFVIHLMPAKHGSCTQEVKTRITKIADICSVYNVQIRFFSVDGDNGYNEMFKNFFQEHIQNLVTRHYDFFSIVETVAIACAEKSIYIPVTDLLHFVKNARSRFIDHRIIVSTDNQASYTNYDDVIKILDLGLPITDTSQLGRMRDHYPIELFRFINVSKLLEANHIFDAFYFFTNSLLLSIIRAPFYELSFRVRLLEITWHIFHHIYLQLTNLDVSRSGFSLRKRYHQGTEFVTYSEELTIIRILCSIIGYGVAFTSYSDDLRTDALGTHPLENRIGQSRNDTSDNRWDRILSSFVQAELRMILMASDGIWMPTPSRLKMAGCVLDKDNLFQCQIDASAIAEAWILAISSDDYHDERFHDALQTVIDFVKGMRDLEIHRKDEFGKSWLPNPAANSGIMARLMKFELKAENL